MTFAYIGMLRHIRDVVCQPYKLTLGISILNTHTDTRKEKLTETHTSNDIYIGAREVCLQLAIVARRELTTGDVTSVNLYLWLYGAGNLITTI